MKIKTALISVSDKSGLEELVAALQSVGVKIYSTGGSAKFLRNIGVEVLDIHELTGFPEILEGRVKTLHPHIYAGILADQDKEAHLETLKKYHLPPIDLVVVNFYPFENTVAKGEGERLAIENIDIGGPCMARAAAKNFSSTAVLTDPSDYPLFIGELKKNKGEISVERSRVLAAKAFVTIAHMDGAIANYFSARHRQRFPEHYFLHVQKQMDLNYGENPHQHAACYQYAGIVGGGYGQLQGVHLSYNNILDAQFASNATSLFSEPAIVIVKHNNPCGAAIADNLSSAFIKARRCDRISAFGGVVACNRPVEEDLAEIIAEMFLEVVIAPQFSSEAKRILAVKDRLRLLLTPGDNITSLMEVRSMRSLLLVQTPDTVAVSAPKVQTKVEPTEKQMRDLLFAWKVAACVKSNAVVLANNSATIGIGAGQMSRIDSARLACQKAALSKIKTTGAVAASDGFFPFPDSVEELAKAGIKAIIQPGGGKNDKQIIEAADTLGVAMVFTGRRHFCH